MTYGGREGSLEGQWQACSGHPRLGLLMTRDWGGGSGWLILDTAWGRTPTSPRLLIPPFSEFPPLSPKHPPPPPRFCQDSPFQAHVPRSRACLLRVWENPSPPSCFLQLAGREMVSVTVSHVPLASEDSRLRGPAHLPWTLSSPPSVSFFPPQRNPQPLFFSRLIAKGRPFVGDHRQRPLYWLREG